MATTLPPSLRSQGMANDVPHRTKGSFARLGRKLLLSLPLGLSGLVQGGAPSVPVLPANPEPAYFKRGAPTLEDRIWAKQYKTPKPLFEQMAPRSVIVHTHEY